MSVSPRSLCTGPDSCVCRRTTQASFSQSRRFSIRTPGKPGAAVGDIRSAWNHFLSLRLHHSSLSFPASPPPFPGFLCFSIPGDEY